VTDWADVAANIAGVTLVRHAVITYNGTWGAGMVQYPGDVVNGLNQYVTDQLCVEVPCPYPATFGFIGGDANSDSYEQSIQAALDWTDQWVQANPTQTFITIGYSQGAEAASRVAMRKYPNFIGGLTFGNPCRMAGAVAPGIGNPGPNWRGISTVNMTELPSIGTQTVWADYVHSKTNGDAGNDMYTMVPTGQVGLIMSDVYQTATQAQINNGGQFLQNMVTDMIKIVGDSGILKGLTSVTALLGMTSGAMLAFLVDLVGGVDVNATGANADVAAAVLGLQFLTASGGPTGPHVSYLGELPGYTNLVANAVGFLHNIATLTPPRA